VPVPIQSGRCLLLGLYIGHTSVGQVVSVFFQVATGHDATVGLLQRSVVLEVTMTRTLSATLFTNLNPSRRGELG
jgi:hypothetical protein